MKNVHMTSWLIFMVRAILGIVFAVLAMRLFYPRAGMVTVMIVAVILVGLAYLLESFRKQKTKS